MNKIDILFCDSLVLVSTQQRIENDFQIGGSVTITPCTHLPAARSNLTTNWPTHTWQINTVLKLKEFHKETKVSVWRIPQIFYEAIFFNYQFSLPPYTATTNTSWVSNLPHCLSLVQRQCALSEIGYSDFVTKSLCTTFNLFIGWFYDLYTFGPPITQCQIQSESDRSERLK